MTTKKATSPMKASAIDPASKTYPEKRTKPRRSRAKPAESSGLGAPKLGALREGLVLDPKKQALLTPLTNRVTKPTKAELATLKDPLSPWPGVPGLVISATKPNVRLNCKNVGIALSAIGALMVKLHVSASDLQDEKYDRALEKQMVKMGMPVHEAVAMADLELKDLVNFDPTRG